MAASIGEGFGPVVHTALGDQYLHYNTYGDLKQADFVLATGSIGMRQFPVGTVLYHAGKIAGSDGACVVQRAITTNGTIADWFNNGVVASTTVSS
jgi:hypothetical protein